MISFTETGSGAKVYVAAEFVTVINTENGRTRISVHGASLYVKETPEEVRAAVRAEKLHLLNLQARIQRGGF